jgi:hypothetical protein
MRYNELGAAIATSVNLLLAVERAGVDQKRGIPLSAIVRADSQHTLEK